MFDISGRHALVTGGASGIGTAIVRALAAAGCHVIAADLPLRPSPQGERTGPTDTGIAVVELDVTDEGTVRRVVNGLDRLDILVNCAGIIRRGEEYELDTFAQVLDVNLTGAMRMCTVCRPLLARQGGSIVNIASMLSFFGGAMVPAYSASKGGVAQLTKSLAIGW